jgi:protein SCO1
MFCISTKRAALACVCCTMLVSCARHYKAQGIVLATDPTARTVTISHRAIPGYMEAMSMPFPVERSENLADLRPGTRVRFQLKVNGSGTVARNIRVEQAAAEDFQVPKARGKIAIGAAMPDFTLTDQEGQAVTLSAFRGQLVAVDFIYTRCPLPDVCPRLSANFARLQKRFAGKMTLLSISLDPEYDTPAVLTEYAHRWGAAAGWHFLTGAPSAIQTVAGRFGVVYWPEEGSITHTSSTAIVDRDGKLAALIEGSSFSSQQLIDLVEQFQRPGTNK